MTSDILNSDRPANRPAKDQMGSGQSLEDSLDSFDKTMSRRNQALSGALSGGTLLFALALLYSVVGNVTGASKVSNLLEEYTSTLGKENFDADGKLRPEVIQSVFADAKVQMGTLLKSPVYTKKAFFISQLSGKPVQFDLAIRDYTNPDYGLTNLWGAAGGEWKPTCVAYAVQMVPTSNPPDQNCNNEDNACKKVADFYKKFTSIGTVTAGANTCG